MRINTLRVSTFILIVIIFSINFFSCKKDLDGFQLEYVTTIKILAGISVFETQLIDVPPIQSNLESFAQSNGVKVADITKIYPTVARITAIQPVTNLEFVEWVKIFFIKESDPNNPIILYDKVNNNSIRNFQFELLPWQSNYLADFKKGAIRIRVQLKYQNNPPSFIDCRLSLFFQAE